MSVLERIFGERRVDLWDPKQPRVPAGSDAGGQFASTGGGGSAVRPTSSKARPQGMSPTEHKNLSNICKRYNASAEVVNGVMTVKASPTTTLRIGPQRQVGPRDYKPLAPAKRGETVDSAGRWIVQEHTDKGGMDTWVSIYRAANFPAARDGFDRLLSGRESGNSLALISQGRTAQGGGL